MLQVNSLETTSSVLKGLFTFSGNNLWILGSVVGTVTVNNRKLCIFVLDFKLENFKIDGE